MRSSLKAQAAPLIGAYVCVHATMSGSRMAAPLLALHQGHGKTAVGALVALFALSQVFLSLPAGRYVDRHGFRKPLGWGVLAASAGIGLAACWPVYPVLGVGALLVGGATGLVSIALQRHVGLAARDAQQRKQVFYWISAAPAFANVIGPLAAGLLIDHAGFRSAFFCLSALPLLAWPLGRGAAEPARPAAAAGGHGSTWDLLRAPLVRRVLLTNALVSSAWELHGFLVPVLGHERGLQASAIGTVLGAFAIAAVVVRFAMPVIAVRMREWVLVVSAFAAASLVLACYPATRSALAMGLCSSLLGLTLGSVQPMVLSLLHQVTPDHRHGEALAMRLMMINVIAVGMPMLLGLMAGLVGASGVFWAMGATVACGSRLGFHLRSVPGQERGEA